MLALLSHSLLIMFTAWSHEPTFKGPKEKKWDVIRENCACFAKCLLFLGCRLTTEYIPEVVVPNSSSGYAELKTVYTICDCALRVLSIFGEVMRYQDRR